MDDRADERYWADYLRISLPAAALLLLLGLFWYWAAALIGGGQESAMPTEAPLPSPTATVAPSPTPPATAPAAIPNPQAAPTPSPTVATNPPAAPVAETPVEAPPPSGCDNNFEVGSVVATTDDDVRIRGEASTSAEVVQTLRAGTPLRISGPAEVSEGCWWPVTNEATNDSGFVREDLLRVP